MCLPHSFSRTKFQFSHEYLKRFIRDFALVASHCIKLGHKGHSEENSILFTFPEWLPSWVQASSCVGVHMLEMPSHVIRPTGNALLLRLKVFVLSADYILMPQIMLLCSRCLARAYLSWKQQGTDQTTDKNVSSSIVDYQFRLKSLAVTLSVSV